MKKWIKITSILLVLWGIAGACRKKDAPLPDNTVVFESANLGISEDADNAEIKIKLSRPAENDVAVVIQLSPEGVEYTADFTTAPVASANTLTLSIPGGSAEASFKINKTAGVLFDGDEKILLKIESVTPPLIIGTVSTLTIAFSEIVSDQASITVDGGGAAYGNKVFIDLSANRQIAIERTKWDLGFYGGDDFRVILNSSTGMMAKALTKTDLNTVTAADTANLDQQMSFNAFSKDALAYIDYPDGDLNKTAIAAVSETPEENKIYIINRGNGIGSPAPARGWKKIRVIRNTPGGYKLQYADISATTFEEIDIPKKSDHFFSYVSFENSAVDVEPAKDKWDIAWTFFTNITSYDGGEIPYTFQDFILQNRNVQTATVLSSVVSYENFAEANLSGLEFNSRQNGIGSGWRAGGGPTSAPSVSTDHFYIVKDGDGNYYKIKFTGLTKDGERGWPSLEYALVKNGAL